MLDNGSDQFQYLRYYRAANGCDSIRKWCFTDAELDRLYYNDQIRRQCDTALTHARAAAFSLDNLVQWQNDTLQKSIAAVVIYKDSLRDSNKRYRHQSVIVQNEKTKKNRSWWYVAGAALLSFLTGVWVAK